MGTPLTMEQFTEIVERIKQQHSFGRHGHTKWIKYIRPTFDMRDNTCFNVTFDHQGRGTNFNHTDEKDMYEAIIEWLEEEK